MASKLIITSAVNYSPEGIRVLLRSAARNIPDSAFLIFHERTDDAFRDELQADHPEIHLVRPTDLDRRARLWRGKRRRRQLKSMPLSRARWLSLLMHTPWRAYGTASLHVVMARYFWGLEAMKHPAALAARQIMLCDSRDVCVQRDPFEAMAGDFVVGAWGVPFERRTMAMKWLNDRFPPEVVRRVAPQPNLSNGIMLGTRPAVKNFLKAATRAIINLKPHPFGQTGDQRLINVLFHGGDQLPFTLTHTGGSLIAHLIQAPWDKLRIDGEGLRTLEGDLICLLHHYEFYSELVEVIREKYAGEAGARPKFHPVRPPPKAPKPEPG